VKDPTLIKFCGVNLIQLYCKYKKMYIPFSDGFPAPAPILDTLEESFGFYCKFPFISCKEMNIDYENVFCPYL
jgi:hypothetical protein